MNKNLDSNDCAKILKALGDESRLKIVRLLLQGEQSVMQIVKTLQMGQPKVSHHLSILRSSGLVETRRDKNKIFNFINPENGSFLKEKAIGIDLGCCSIQFDDTQNPSS